MAKVEGQEVYLDGRNQRRILIDLFLLFGKY